MESLWGTMRRFNLYVGWEITKIFVVALVTFAAVIMLAVVSKEMATQGLGVGAFLQLLPYALPMSLQYALPPTILFAVASVYGRVSADNEVLSLMAAGVKPMRIISPILIACFLLSLFAVWINDIAMPWGKPGISRVVMHSVEQVVYGFLSTQGNYTSERGFSIHVRGLSEDGELLSPTITMIPEESKQPLVVSARTGRLTMDAENDTLSIELTDSSLDAGDKRVVIPGPSVHEISLSDATKKGTSGGHYTEVAMRNVGSEIRTELGKIHRIQGDLAARSALFLTVGKHEYLDNAVTRQSLSNIQVAKNDIRRLEIEPWRRWAQGFSCFCFVWVAIPFAIWFRAADNATSFGACFLPILFLYYPLFAVGLGNAKAGDWPPYSVWLGNLVLLIVGAFWLHKLHRR